MFAGGENQLSGARFSGMANASVSLSDPWCTFHNQAGLGFLKKPVAAIYYGNPFLVSQLSVKSGTFALPIKAGTFGLSFSDFGYSLYKENRIGLAFAKAFGENISAGIQMDYMHFAIGEEYGSRSAIVAEMGIQARVWKGLTIGAHIYNPTMTKLADYNDERIPTTMRLGADFKFSDKVLLAVETEKNIDQKADLRAGIEYRIIKELYLRAGFATNPSLSCFGIGLELKKFKLDLSSTYHATLGFSPQIGMTYDFK